MKIILLNGPPNSGKDEAARAIDEWADKQNVYALVAKFSLPIKRAFEGLTGLPWESFDSNKESIIPFLGVSFRQWQIDFSEKFMKPLYGPDIFARLAFDEIQAAIRSGVDLVVVSDCGFQIEADYIAFRWPRADLRVVQCRRPGTSFSGDSREWVTAQFPEQFRVLHNELSLETYRSRAVELAKEFLSG